MTHIGIDARLNAYQMGGISTYARQLTAALEQLDPEGHYTIFHSRKATDLLTTNFCSAALWTPPHNRVMRLALALEVARFRLDILHCPDFIPPFFGAKRMVITVHDLTFLHYPQYITADSRRYYNDQIQAAVQKADHILTVSESAKADIIERLHVESEKITVQPNGVDANFRPLTPEQIDPIIQKLDLPSSYILHVGTFEPRKNLITLVRAYKILKAQFPDTPPLVFVGRRGWLYDEMMHDIHDVGVSDHLIWRENVDHVALPAVYNKAAALVMASHYEGFGLPPLEAMACGTIPLVSNRASLPEIVGDVGLQFDPDDPAALADALAFALTHNTWRATMRQRGLTRAAHFTWANSAQIALSVYRSLS